MMRQSLFFAMLVALLGSLAFGNRPITTWFVPMLQGYQRMVL